MRQKTLSTLLVFIGIALIHSSAFSFHEHPANPDPEQRAAHAVNSDCRVLQHSEYHTAKVICGDNLIAIIDERDTSHLRVVGIVHHHDDGTVHAWIDAVFAETGQCKGKYREVLTVEEMDTLLHLGAILINANEAFRRRYENGV